VDVTYGGGGPSKAILGAGGMLLAGVGFYALFWNKISTALLGKSTPLEKQLHPSLEALPPRERVLEVREKGWSEQVGGGIDKISTRVVDIIDETKKNIEESAEDLKNTAKDVYKQGKLAAKKTELATHQGIINLTPPPVTGSPPLDMAYHLFAYVMRAIYTGLFPLDVKNLETDAEKTEQQVAEALKEKKLRRWSSYQNRTVRHSEKGIIPKIQTAGRWFLKTYFGAGQGKVSKPIKVTIFNLKKIKKP
jgi:hypothetical protein